MFSLIVTIISIALVAALALATLYYGGSAFNKSSANAAASKILLQGQQLLGAADLYKADTGEWPASMDVLVTENYLKSIPVAQGPMSEALAAYKAWVLPLADSPVFVLTNVEAGTCANVNKKSYGVEAVLQTARTVYLNQCFGLTTNALKVVVGKASGDLAQVAADPAATVSLGVVSALPAPTDRASAEWLDLSGTGTMTPLSFAPTAGFISLNAGTAGTYVGAQVSTTILPELLAGYIGGSSVRNGTPAAATEVYLMSATASMATYLMARYIDGYTKMVQVSLTLSGTSVYAQARAARYTLTELTTGPDTNVLTLWSGGATAVLAASGDTADYGATNLTVIGH